MEPLVGAPISHSCHVDPLPQSLFRNPRCPFSPYRPIRYAPNARSSVPFTAARNTAGATTATSAPCRRMAEGECQCAPECLLHFLALCKTLVDFFSSTAPPARRQCRAGSSRATVGGGSTRVEIESAHYGVSNRKTGTRHAHSSCTGRQTHCRCGSSRRSPTPKSRRHPRADRIHSAAQTARHPDLVRKNRLAAKITRFKNSKNNGQPSSPRDLPEATRRFPW